MIETIFPKSLVILDNILDPATLNNIFEATENVLNMGTDRSPLLNVDSTALTTNNLQDNPLFDALTIIIHRECQNYMKHLGYSSDQISNRNITKMWANHSATNDYLFPHVHPESCLSGAFYITTPENSEIVFFDSIDSTFPEPACPNSINHTTVNIPCKNNRLLIFKSNLLHATTGQLNNNKIVLSFNYN